MIRCYEFDWHPWGTTHQVYLSGTQADFQKLESQVAKLTTPEISNQDNKAYKQILTKAFKGILQFIKKETGLRVHKTFKIHYFIFEEGNGPNQAHCDCGKIGAKCLAQGEKGHA